MSERSNTGAKYARDELLIQLLAAGRSATEAGAAAGCSGDTVYRRLRDPEFRAALLEARSGLWQEDAAYLRSAVRRSVELFITVRDNPDETTSNRLRAADMIIERAIQLHELVDTRPRLAAIEAQLAEAADASSDV